MGTPRLPFLFAGVAIAALVAFAWYERPEAASAPIAQPAKPVAMTPTQATPPTVSQPESVDTLAAVAETSSSDPAVPETLATIRSLGAGAEQALVLSENGMRFEMTNTLMDHLHFDELIGAMDSDLVGLERQDALLPLFYKWAGAHGIAVDRLACGEKVCALRIYGPNQEALESYVQAVADASEGQVLSRNVYDRIDSPGLIERRMIFATDQSANGFVIENPGT